MRRLFGARAVHQLDRRRDNLSLSAAGLQSGSDHLKREVTVSCVRIDVARIRGAVRQRDKDRLAGGSFAFQTHGNLAVDLTIHRGQVDVANS